MKWFFAYGRWTDSDLMRRDIGGWNNVGRAALPDHVYTFTGNHPQFGGGSSTINPLPGGITLGVAYQINEQQLQRLQQLSPGYELREKLGTIDGVNSPMLMLERTVASEASPPAETYLDLIRRGLSQHYQGELVDMYLARATKRASGEMLVDRKISNHEAFNQEYGGEFRRLFPWKGTRQSLFGSAWMIIQPGEASTPHNHDEEETFIFLGGQGLMSVDGEEFLVHKGDAVYLEPFSAHTVRNIGADPLEVLCVWWGGVAQP